MQTMLTVKEVAIELGYNPEIIRKLIRQGKIPCIRLHKQRIRIKKSWLDKMLSEDTVNQFNQAKEDKSLGITEPKAEILNENKEVENVTKNNAETTEITTTKPKVKQFIPNPKKRMKKEVIEPEYTEDSLDDNEPDNFVDDNDNGDSDQGFLEDYKGIGNYD
jgi:excisionase family DNA binding protein